MNPTSPLRRTEPAHVVFLKHLKEAVQEFAQEIENAPDENGEEAYLRGNANLNLSRFAYVMNLRQKKDYNPLELVQQLTELLPQLAPQSLKDGKYYFDESTISSENFFLAISLMASLDTIGTKESFQALHDCMINKNIDLTVRQSVISNLSRFAHTESFKVVEKVQPALIKEIKETVEIEDAKSRVTTLKKALETMREKEIF